MSDLITTTGGHRIQLSQMLIATKGVIRVASAYVTDTDLLLSARTANRETRLLTALSRDDIDCGASSLDSLRKLVESGVCCRCLFGRPKFHAKVYIMGQESALVTSANLTRNALDSNIEVGSLVQGEAIADLTEWFDSLWESAAPLDKELIASLVQQTAVSRSEHLLLPSYRPLVIPNLRSHTPTKPSMPDPQQSSRRYFLCNTNRRHNMHAEMLMRTKGFVAAWETYSYTTHVERVTKGDIIFMYANGVGIIAIGQAKDKCKVLDPGDHGLVVANAESTEWQIPVAWLTWVDAAQAARWYPVLRQTFVDISDNKYAERRMIVILHLLGNGTIPS